MSCALGACPVWNGRQKKTGQGRRTIAEYKLVTVPEMRCHGKGQVGEGTTSPMYTKPEHPEAQHKNGVQTGSQKKDAVTLAEEPVN